MRKLQIIGMLASIEFEAIVSGTVSGDPIQKRESINNHVIGHKCPVRIQLDGKIKKDSVLLFIPSKLAIDNNVNVQFLPYTNEDRKNGNIEAVVTVMGEITLVTGSRLNVIPNKFPLGSVICMC